MAKFYMPKRRVHIEVLRGRISSLPRCDHPELRRPPWSTSVRNAVTYHSIRDMWESPTSKHSQMPELLRRVSCPVPVMDFRSRRSGCVQSNLCRSATSWTAMWHRESAARTPKVRVLHHGLSWRKLTRAREHRRLRLWASARTNTSRSPQKSRSADLIVRGDAPSAAMFGGNVA